jgi:formylmethanofuran--tetrahydromethanopterin N-formyltransferase
MQIKGVTIEDTFAEAFPMYASRLVITAATGELARLGAEAASGMAFSIIGCGCEAGIGARLDPSQTPDGRPGCELLLFSYSAEKLEEHLMLRISQAILPTATTACFNGLPEGLPCKVGGRIRYFGNGFQSSKMIMDKRYWRIPVADGEFLCEESFNMVEGIGGGNLILIGKDQQAAWDAACNAVAAIRSVEGVIAPFPGGICRSPSIPGSKYKNVRASTNDPFCPTLRTRTNTRLPEKANAVYEIVIDGLTEEGVAKAMALGIKASCVPGMLVITAGNYGGKLGKFHFHLHQLVEGRKR